MGFFSDIFSPSKSTKARWTPRSIESELKAILGGSNALYQNAAEYDPLFAELGADSAGRAASRYARDYTSLTPELAETNARTQSDLLKKYSPEYMQTLRGTNPGQADLVDMITRTAAEGLAAGGRLTPDQTYTATQPVRANWAARGFSADAMPAQLAEAVNLARTSEDVLSKRQGAAAGAAQLADELYTRPATTLAISAPGLDAGSILGLGVGTAQNSPGAWEQLGPYGSQLFGGNLTAGTSAAMNDANNRTALTQGTLSSIGSGMSSY